jgi:hypothetical protein
VSSVFYDTHYLPLSLFDDRAPLEEPRGPRCALTGEITVQLEAFRKFTSSPIGVLFTGDHFVAGFNAQAFMAGPFSGIGKISSDFSLMDNRHP